MDVSTITSSTSASRHGSSPLLRLQSDEHPVRLTRAGNDVAFEALVARYHGRLLSFCRHLLGSREDAEDVLQEALSAAYGALHSDERPINVRPWLYKIARNRSLNHLRRVQAVGLDSMDVLLSEHGETTADKVHRREEFRQLVGDINQLPETQRTALILREMDALSYEQIAEAMETTVSSVKSLLVRARVSLAEASQSRLLSCDQVRFDLGEVAEGLLKRANPLVRRHVRSCERCRAFEQHLRRNNRALAALLPGPLVLWRGGVLSHLSGSAGAGAGLGAGLSAGVAGSSSPVLGAGLGGLGALAAKTAAGLAAAALVTAGAVVVKSTAGPPRAPTPHTTPALASATRSGARSAGGSQAAGTISAGTAGLAGLSTASRALVSQPLLSNAPVSHMHASAAHRTDSARGTGTGTGAGAGAGVHAQVTRAATTASPSTPVSPSTSTPAVSTPPVSTSAASTVTRATVTGTSAMASAPTRPSAGNTQAASQSQLPLTVTVPTRLPQLPTSGSSGQGSSSPSAGASAVTNRLQGVVTSATGLLAPHTQS